VGADVLLIDGKGSLADASIQELRRNETILKIGAVLHKAPPKHCFTLALAYIRPQKLELAIEKGVELGIDRFILFPSDHSDAKAIDRERLENILKGALKQSGRLFMPEVIYEKELTLPQERLFYGSLEEGASPLTNLPEKATFFVGPEGGFSQRELDLLKEATKLFLGPHILRAETAAIALSALIAAQLHSL
jgi:16S rRNA (uracil1498-N3)-methyltransferase